MLDGWKAIANHLEQLSGRARSRFTLMRLALRGPDPLPVNRDVNNRPVADSNDVEEWYARHQYTY